ncbi:hypothetical protein HaLaN_27510 [Haematococcus lacustris]|uniref:S1 motif domain-containing protein n=1 Tax=Haematococcus lacustris TaxID=44745 RepID=A0A6A0A8B3_HAELA|nr:hypothetical protein HaLaN_27510 [Haematococcus lacustris]
MICRTATALGPWPASGGCDGCPSAVRGSFYSLLQFCHVQSIRKGNGQTKPSGRLWCCTGKAQGHRRGEGRAVEVLLLLVLLLAPSSSKAVVVSATNDRSIQVSTKALELVPGQMKTDKQAVFASAAEGLAQYLVSKKEIMDQRQQALTQLQVGSVMTGTAKLRRKDGWLIALDGVAALVHRSNLDHNLERGQSVQILITGIKQQSAVALATARFEKKPDGTYQPLPRLRPKLTETKAATKPAIEPASKA